MAVIQRKDGTQFVIRCYRETLSLTNINLFKQHAFLISEMHGYFAKFLPGRNSKTIESVFSSDAGFLLAEMIWQHFGKPETMIYCEKYDEDQFITVIVRDNLIFTDGNLPASELREELAAASINIGRAPIYLHGDIPGFIEPKNLETDPPLLKFNHAHIEHLENSVFNELVPAPNFEMVPIQQAISDLQLSKASRRNVIGLIVLAVVFVFGVVSYYVMSRPEPIEQIDPLENFRNALTSPSPQDELNETAKTILVLQGIPGWRATKITISGPSVSASLNSFGGSAEGLLNWALFHQASIKFNNTDASASLSMTSTPPRTAPLAPEPMQRIIAKMIDTTIALSLKKSIDIGAITSKGAYSTCAITLHLSDVSAKSLLLFGSFLNTLPITIDSISLDTSGPLMNGNLMITAYGS